MNKIFANNLKRLRTEKKWTQEQVVEKLGISDKALSRWETGTTLPDVLLLPEIAKLYGVLVDDLFRESARGYANLALRLLAVFERTHRHEDFWNAYLEFQKLFDKGEPTADDYRSFGVLHEYMLYVCKEKAQALYDQTMKICENVDTEMYYRAKGQKILMLCNTGGGKDCVEQQRQRVKEEPENPDEWVCLLSAYLRSDQVDEAYRTFETAINKFSDNATLYIYGGDICRQQKKYDEAFRYWEKQLELEPEPEYADSLFSIAFCYEEIGKYREAYDAWNRVISNLEARGLTEEAIWPKEMAEKCRNRM